KRLVPDLGEMLRRRPACANARIGTIEEEQATEPVGVRMRERLRGKGADIVRDDADALQAEPVYQRQNIAGVHVCTRLCRGPVRRLLGIAEPAQVRRDHVELGRERGNAPPPDATELRPTVQEQERGAAPLAEVMNADAVRRNVVRLEAGHTTSP